MNDQEKIVSLKADLHIAGAAWQADLLIVDFLVEMLARIERLENALRDKEVSA